jgi:hypothetical protein
LALGVHYQLIGEGDTVTFVSERIPHHGREPAWDAIATPRRTKMDNLPTRPPSPKTNTCSRQQSAQTFASVCRSVLDRRGRAATGDTPARFDTLRRFLWLPLGVLVAVGTGTPVMVQSPAPPPFFVHAFGGTLVRNSGKCLDYAPGETGSPVVLDDCNASHTIVVDEITDEPGFHVMLRAGSHVIGVRRPEGGVVQEFPLELQQPTGNADQKFALDGDSVILASDRRLVAKVQNGAGTNGTPIVLGARQLAADEFWDFRAIGGRGEDPHSGFVRVSTIDELLNYISPYGCDGACAPFPAQPGTVIRVMDSMVFPATLQPLQIPEGVTIRGDRTGTVPGPELWMEFTTPGGVMLEVAGDNVRITGLRVRGPNAHRNTQHPEHSDRGILVNDVNYAGTIVDHNDIYEWDDQGVLVKGNDPDWLKEQTKACGPQDNIAPRNRPYRTRVARNFIHHNLPQDKGYGVNANSGAFPLVEGNTFVANRHAIAETNSTPGTGYRAWYNLVLTRAPSQYFYVFFTHDFDIHGTGGDPSDNGFGGIAGGYVDIFSNTFFGTNRYNFEVRGNTCEYIEFRNNVSLQSRDDTLSIDPGLSGEGILVDLRVASTPRQFNRPNPTRVFGVGDFDGDDTQDLFMATGTAWYYSPGGIAEWRFLNARPDRLEDLLFGDFDGDGRTDVLGKNGTVLRASWGGTSEWTPINSIDAPLQQLAIGDFDGSGRDDIFYANGTEWLVAYDGGPFVPTATSSLRVPNLRFGDFDGDGGTDVFGVVAGAWQFSRNATSSWTLLRSRLTNTVSNLVVADFDGDGRDDIGTATPQASPFGPVQYRWRFSSGGAGGWTDIRTTPLVAAAVGRFTEGRARVLLWLDEHLRYAQFEVSGTPRHSRQDMR